MRNAALMAAAAAVLVSSIPSFAHHPGGAGNLDGAGPIVTISAFTLEQGQSAVAVIFEMTRIKAFTDAQLAAYASRHVHAHSLDRITATSAAFAYGITSDIMISARLPYVVRSDIKEAHHAHVHGGPTVNEAEARGGSEGIGDVTALVHWRVLNNRESGMQVTLLGGFRAPVGSTQRTDRSGTLFETEFQPGTGSWDVLTGAAVTKRIGRWSFDANVLFALAGRGDQQTDLGNRFNYNAAVSYRLVGGTASSPAAPMSLGAMPEPMYHGAGRGQAMPHTHAHVEASPPSGPSLDAVLELNGEWHGRQVIAGVDDPNSGGRVTYLTPGLRLSGQNWSSYVSAGIPVSTNMYGVQAAPDLRLLTGIGISF